MRVAYQCGGTGVSLFPIDKSDNKEGCNAVRFVNAFSPDSKAFHSYLWRRQPQTQQRADASGCTAHRSRLESIAQSVNVAERLRKSGISFATTNYDVANAHPCPSHASLGGFGGHTARRHGTPKTTPRACHDGNPGRRREHPYPTRIRHSPGQRGSSGCLSQGVPQAC